MPDERFELGNNDNHLLALPLSLNDTSTLRVNCDELWIETNQQSYLGIHVRTTQKKPCQTLPQVINNNNNNDNNNNNNNNDTQRLNQARAQEPQNC